MLKPIGLQLYTLRDALTEDFTSVIKQIADMGYVAVEPYGGIPVTMQEAKTLFDDLGLQVPSAHLLLPIGDDQDELLETASTLGISHYIIPWLPSEDFASVDSIKHVCERLNQANEVVKAQGMTLGYHNHWWEFQTIDGQIAYDIMLENIDPSIVLEIDTYWVQVAGQSIPNLLNKLGKRAPLLHLKDGPADNNESPMVAVGEGVIDFKTIIQEYAENTDYLIVELDRCATDMLTAVENSFTYLINEGLGHGRQS